MPKKPKLTPQERKKLRAEKKRLKKLEKLEKARQIKRDHLEREVKYGALNVKRYEKNWRDMLIKIAQPRMRQELEFAWHNFERVIDTKDFTISLLMEELRDAEEQYMLNFKTHLENLDKLMDMFHDRLEELHNDYFLGVNNLQGMYESEVDGLNGTASDSLEYLKTMLHRLEVEKKEHEKMIRAEYYSKIDETEVKNQLAIQKLRSSLENKYQDLFDQVSNFVHNFNKAIKDRKKEHDALKEQDDAIQELIRSQFKKIQELFEALRLLKQKFNDMKQTEGNRLMDLQAEKQYFADTFKALKNKMEDDRAVDFNKLACLSKASADAFNYLEELNNKGENILKMSSICRNLETQKEKILPFPIGALGAESSTERRNEDYEEPTAVKKELELLWQRVGQAASVKYAVNREEQCLKEENSIFVDAYNDYCENLEKPKIIVYRNKFGTINKTDATQESKKYKKYYTNNKAM